MTLLQSSNPKQAYPEDVLSDINAPWRVAHTKSRREKALAHFLAREKIGYYLPMFFRKQAGSKRVRHSFLPLFSGYLFFISDDWQRYTALRSNHIAKVIDVPDTRTLLAELDQVRRALVSGMPLLPVDSLDKGQRVRVIKGPFQDLEGIIVRRKNECRLVLSISSIRQAVSIEIDADYVAPLR